MMLLLQPALAPVSQPLSDAEIGERENMENPHIICVRQSKAATGLLRLEHSRRHGKRHEQKHLH